MGELKEKLEKRFGGVYMLFDKGKVVYVGQSSNVPSRIKKHIEEGKKVFDDFSIYFCDNRREMEITLIHLFEPVYNKQDLPQISPEREKDVRAEDRDIDFKVYDAEQDAYEIGQEIVCDIEDVKRLFPKDYGMDIPYEEIMRKYGAYRGKWIDGKDKYSLINLFRFHREIKQEIFEEAASQILEGK